MTEHIMVYVTVPSMETAQPIARKLIHDRLAACVNVLPGMTSFYRWEGEVQQDAELVLIAKTRQELFAELSAAVQQLHPYECPCIVALPITDGHDAFLNWLTTETTRG